MCSLCVDQLINFVSTETAFTCGVTTGHYACSSELLVLKLILWPNLSFVEDRGVSHHKCNLCYVKTLADFQNVSCFVFEQSIVFLKVAIQNVYNISYFKTSSMCIFNAVTKQSGIGFMVNALLGNFAYLHNLYTVVELHTNFVLIHFESQPLCDAMWCILVSRCVWCYLFYKKNVHFI